MTSKARVAVVTGATQGLGLALVRGLSRRLRKEDLVLLTSRDPERVAQVVAEEDFGPARVEGQPLDVTDAAAIERLSAELVDRFGGVDIVISNATARMSPGRPAAEQIDAFVDTSNVATSSVLRLLLPIVKSGGTLLVVASGLGRLGYLPAALRPRFDDAHSLDDIDREVETWRARVLDGSAVEHGWPEWANIPSKVAQVAAVRVVAAQRRARDLTEGRLLASVCPGLVDTGASRPWFSDMSQAQSPDQAAVAVLDLALARPIEPETYGELVQFGRVLSWGGDVIPLEAMLGTST